jgi:uncharacterized membrane protein YgcG
MLGGVKARSHAVVALSVLVVGAFALFGLIGENARDEKIEQLQVVVSGEGESGLRITETIDQDFGTSDRHGPELIVPNDFGTPIDVTASSPDAPAQVNVAPAPWDAPISGTRIRVGDPDVTITGQHRYTISYVLPAARFANATFSLDAVGAASAIPIEDVTVVFSGIELDEPRCTVGTTGSEDECAFERGAPLRLGVDRLDPYEGITVSGEVRTWGPGDAIEPPAIPERREDRRGVTALAVMALGGLGAAGVHLWARRSGANEVAGAGAADAAGGPGSLVTATRRVSDAELAEMATVAFAPPRGLEPWQGAVVLTEVLDQSSVTAWFSGAVAADVLTIEQRGSSPRLGRGPRFDDVDAVTADILDALFANREVVDLDGFDASFARAWTKVEEQQKAWVRSSGWWSTRPPRPGAGKPGGCATFAVLAILAIPVMIASAFLLGLLGVVGGIVTAVVVGLGLPVLVARVAYAPLLPGRTANGSAYALQVASFHRFLVESEGQHVEWAWKQGVLRQYSAWAVALDAADAWQAAMERAGVPRAEVDHSSPMLVHSMSGRFVSSHIAPSTSGSGGSSGSSFSGGGSSGSVGGGGGGGSHGSW